MGGLMRRFLIAAIATVSTITFGQIASAADVASKAAPAPVAAPAFSWTGFYVGAHAGVDWASGEDLTFTDPNVPNVIRQTSLGGFSSDNLGIVGGIHAGYNWQFAPAWVLGIEGDFSGSSLSKRNAAGPLFFGGNFVPNTFLEMQVQNNWLATIRGRLGFTGWWNTMFYVTGGGAWAGVKFSGVEHNDPPTFAAFFRSDASSHDTRSGWVVGGGAEMPLSDHFLARVEYLYYKFDGTTLQANLLPNPGAFPRAFVYDFSGLNINVVRLGLSYKF
jgi:outer membrane immunogenic protein